MKFRKNSLTGSFIRRTGIIFILLVLFGALFYRWIFPTYYYWKMEQPVKATQKLIQQGSHHYPKDVVVLTVDEQTTSSEELTDELSFRLTREGISLNRFWVDQSTLKQAQAGRAVQRLYNQTKQKSDFYTIFLTHGDHLYLIGTSIPDFKAAIHTLLPILIVATLIFLILLFGLVILLVRNQIIKPITRLEQATRQISALDFTDSDIQEKNELSSLSQSISQMKDSLQQHELELLEQNDRLKAFSANLAHELKTPLSVIQLLVDGEEMGLENPDFLSDINQQLIDMNELVANILAYSRQLKEELTFETIAIQELVTKELQQQRIIDPKFQIDSVIEPCELQTNESMLRMIVLNLVTNGMKYSLDQHMQITGEKKQQYYQLIFENSASEISQQQLAQLAEPFVVGEASRNNHLSGTGLGLSIVAQSLQLLGGKLVLQSTDGRFRATINLPS
ncbi:HAMP domain-containing sensor histidine kinase [Enterococcus devriesei]|uniref:sensor histidine kinase n=1 Tax=Enterococcus devriesei TaxID=319970 RepID=UPI0028AE5350|nr:HAMP domain-containing sensor histidine kinase [Enterococcus devriesei]